MAMSWDDYLAVPDAERAYGACHTGCGEAYVGLRGVIATLVRRTRPGTVACLGAGVLNDIPYDVLVAAGATIHLVDWLPGAIDSGIRRSIIGRGEQGRPVCAYCTLDDEDAGAYCRRFRPSRDPSARVCERYRPAPGASAACESFERGERPHVLEQDVTAGYATAFGRGIPAALHGVGTWKQAFRRACNAARQARRSRVPLGIADGRVDLVTTSMVMSQFDWEPYTYFSRHTAAIVGPPSAHEEHSLRQAGESLRFELAVSQIERHCDEIARIMAPGGCCFAAFEIFQFDNDERGWFLVRETHQALGILGERFAFDHDILPPEESAFRIEAGDAPAVVQAFVLRHK